MCNHHCPYPVEREAYCELYGPSQGIGPDSADGLDFHFCHECGVQDNPREVLSPVRGHGRDPDHSAASAHKVYYPVHPEVREEQAQCDNGRGRRASGGYQPGDEGRIRGARVQCARLLHRQIQRPGAGRGQGAWRNRRCIPVSCRPSCGRTLLRDQPFIERAADLQADTRGGEQVHPVLVCPEHERIPAEEDALRGVRERDHDQPQGGTSEQPVYEASEKDGGHSALRPFSFDCISFCLGGGGCRHQADIPGANTVPAGTYRIQREGLQVPEVPFNESQRGFGQGTGDGG